MENKKESPTIEDVIDWKQERICDDCRYFFQSIEDDKDMGKCAYDKKMHNPDDTCKHFWNE